MPGPSPCVCPQGGLISGLCRQRGVVDRGHLPCVGGGGRPHLLLCSPDLARGGPFSPCLQLPWGPAVTKNPGLFSSPWGIKTEPSNLCLF